MRSLGRALIQDGGCPPKKGEIWKEREFIHTHTHTRRRIPCEDTDTGNRGRMEFCCPKPKNAWGFQKLPEVKKGFSTEGFGMEHGSTHTFISDVWPPKL